MTMTQPSSLVCDACRQEKEPLKGALINGIFGQYCANCLMGQTRQANPRSAQYARDRDRDSHEADLLQPWDAKGNPSREFIRNYPDEAKDNFTEAELKEFG